MSVFLAPDEIAQLTGRKLKRLQVDALRKMGIPFYVNAIGKPVVTLAAVEGRKEPPPKKVWTPPK